MEQMAQAFGGLIKGRYPNIAIRHVQPVATRACFNTRILDKTLNEAQRYPARKQLSVLALQKTIGPERWARGKTTFGDKLDDAAEAGLLALYTYHVPVAKRRLKATPTTENKKLSLTVPLSGNLVKLTDAEREPVLKRARETVAKKKKRVEKKRLKISKA